MTQHQRYWFRTNCTCSAKNWVPLILITRRQPCDLLRAWGPSRGKLSRRPQRSKSSHDTHGSFISGRQGSFPDLVLKRTIPFTTTKTDNGLVECSWVYWVLVANTPPQS